MIECCMIRDINMDKITMEKDYGRTRQSKRCMGWTEYAGRENRIEIVTTQCWTTAKQNVVRRSKKRSCHRLCAWLCCIAQFYPWFNFDFPLLFSMLIYDNEYQTKENQN